MTIARPAETGRRHRRILWMVLDLNVETFLVEILVRVIVGSVSLCADALGFFGDLVTN
jgi:Co/Zn/Cd efflux system component